MDDHYGRMELSLIHHQLPPCPYVVHAIVDTWFRTHDLIKGNDLNDHSCTQKIMIALHA